MDVQDAHRWLLQISEELAALFQKLPGSSIALRYIKSSYQNDPIRSLIELFLCLFAVRYLLAPSYSTQKKSHVSLTAEEVDELVDEWQPEPLVAAQSPADEIENEKRPVIVGPTAPRSKLLNGRTVTNLASYNHHNFNSSEELKEKAIETLRTYGVGPCGPPGFYGTQDVHARIENDIAAHIGMQSAIIYAQAFSTISSVIPAFSKRGDIIVADKAVNFAIRKGIQISRSTVRWYEHNDMEDLERVLAKVVKEQAKKPLTRRFIVTEALSEDVGDMTDLPRIVELKSRYKFRLILDETWSYGVLGRTGRGITEYQHVDPTSVEMIIGSLAGSLCAGGGFCAGASQVIYHQKISAAAFTFSAALPAMLATTASEAINILQTNPSILVQTREATQTMWAQLDPRSEWVKCCSSPENPMVMVVLKPEVVTQKKLSLQDQEALMQEVVDECLANGVLISRRKAMPKGDGTGRDLEWEAPPAVRVCVTSGLTKKEIEKAGTVIRHAFTKVVKARRP